MATAPWFVISPSAVLSAIGLLRGPDRTVPTPAEDWREAVVDVVIPAFHEADNIVHCLASVVQQTVKPRNVILVDDGSDDDTCARAEAFASSAGLPLTVIRRQSSIGKTPTIKRQSREFDSDVEFILDGDTFLESENYLERCIQALYEGVGIASACGTILPMRLKDRKKIAEGAPFQKYLNNVHYDDPFAHKKGFHAIWWSITNIYRECLYLFLQRFIYVGQMTFFGGITNPVGCAVAYRRKYIKNLFDEYEPIFGDDLTNSEDIFIGFALNNVGYRNIQLMDVVARSEEPEVQRLPRQVYLWSSSFLQSCFYFDDLVKSPFKIFRQLRRSLHERSDAQAKKVQGMRKIQEAYRQPFGKEITKKYGRPLGWVVFTSAFEKVSFPAALIIMTLLSWWETLAITMGAEMILSLVVLAVVNKGERLKSVMKGLLITPLRYVLLLYDTVTLGRFATDLWVTGNRKWRK